jgi:hypothetical protein
MKALLAVATVGLSLLAPIGAASAQPWGGPDYGYRERNEGYGERGPRYRERDSGERGRGYRERGGGFDEREYLRCNPDVARAVERGQMQSGFMHYQGYGRREGRRLSC